MHIALPDKNGSLIDAVHWLTSGDNKDQLGRSKPGKIEALSIPKFKMSKEYDIRQWSIADSIYGDKANFSLISDTKLKVSKNIHKVVIEVNEEGTFAAAATSIEVVHFSRNLDHGISFIANRPFIFCVWDKFNWVSLFVGLIKKL